MFISLNFLQKHKENDFLIYLAENIINKQELLL